MSELVREALRRYESLESLRELQAYGERRARGLGITEEDVDRLIHEDRVEKRLRPKGEALERKAS